MNKVNKNINKFWVYLLWRLNSRHFMHQHLKYLKRLGVNIQGTPKYISFSASFDGTNYSNISIGDTTVISSDVRFLTHDYSIMRASYAVGKHPENIMRVVKSISVGKNCFIGGRSLILPGVTIGDNVIIGAGSVVTRNVPSNCVAAGNPAKVIRSIEDYYKKVMENDKKSIVIERKNLPQ